MFRLVSFIVIALLLGTPAYAQDKTAEIDKMFSWATPNAPGGTSSVAGLQYLDSTPLTFYAAYFPTEPWNILHGCCIAE